MSRFTALRYRRTRTRGDESLLGPQLMSGAPAEDLWDDDPVLLSLAEELGELGRIDLPAAPRERTWAVVRAQVARTQARGDFGRVGAVAARSLRRLALGGAALAAAITLGAVALTGGFGDADQVASDPSTSGPVVAEGSTTDTVAPSSTEPVSGPTSTQGQSSTDLPSSTEAPDDQSPATAPQGTQPTSDVGSTVPETSGQKPTSSTVPPSTSTTTGGGMMTSEERQRYAPTVAASLAEKLINGSLAGADSMVTGRAQGDLVHMRATLNEPFGYHLVETAVTSSGASVLLEMMDRVYDEDSGGLVEAYPRFILEMQVDGDDSLVITRIYSAPPS